MDSVINNLIEIDKKARLIVDEAEIKSQNVLNSIAVAQKEFELKYDDKAQIRLNKVKEEESRKIKDSCRQIKDKYDVLIEKLEKNYYQNHKDIENKIFNNILEQNWLLRGLYFMYVKETANVIATKLRALYAKKLTVKDYEQLVNQYSIAGVINYLKNETPYKSALESCNENSIHRGQFELLLKIAIFEQYTKFIHYKLPDEVNIFKYMILQNEMEQMVTAIRLFNIGKMQKYAVDLPVFLLKYTKMDLKKIASVQSYEDLVNIAKGTVYYEPLKICRPENGKIDVVRCETELRKAFYKTILSKINKKDERTKSAILFTIEIFNISIIYRLKKYFNKEKKYIKKCLMPFYLNLNESIIDKMIDVDDVDELCDIIYSTKYKRYFQGEDLSNINLISDKILYDVLSKNIKFSNSCQYTMICYIYLTDIELKNIITIIECISYKFSPEEIKKLLVI